MELKNCSFKENRKIIYGSSRGVSELSQDDIPQHLVSCSLPHSGLRLHGLNSSNTGTVRKTFLRRAMRRGNN